MMIWSEVWTLMTGYPTNLKVGFERYTTIFLILPLAAPYLYSAQVKDYNMKWAKYVLIKFYV